MSNAYVLNVQGKCMREMNKDFLQTQYLLTYVDKDHEALLKDINKEKPKYTF